MPRPVNADSAATRARILAASRQLFSERGAGGTSIRAIARRSGVSLAMVHHYFGSKDDLHKACVDSLYAEMDTLRADLDAAMRRGGSLSELIERAMRAAWRFARERQAPMRLLMRAVMEAGELAAEYRDRAQQPFLDQVPEAIGALVGRPAASLRLPLQSIVNVLVRYAISTDRELMMFTGARTPAAAECAAEDHLVETARLLLRVTP